MASEANAEHPNRAETALTQIGLMLATTADAS